MMDELHRNVRDRESEPEANVRDSGPVEGVRGNREVPPDGPAGAEEAASDTAPGPDRVDELGEAQRQRDEYLDALQRLKAEFDNYRKRVAREQQQLSVRAAERIVVQLLPMLDDLERAIDAAVEHGETKVADGVRLVHRSLAAMLEREGLVEVETDGAFDPHTQEALLTQPSDAPEGTVIQVLQPGYKLGDHVLRPARVVISSGLPEAEPPVRDSGPGEGV
jgi:molecular chaperone GrpE